MHLPITPPFFLDPALVRPHCQQLKRAGNVGCSQSQCVPCCFVPFHSSSAPHSLLLQQKGFGFGIPPNETYSEKIKMTDKACVAKTTINLLFEFEVQCNCDPCSYKGSTIFNLCLEEPESPYTFQAVFNG